MAFVCATRCHRRRALALILTVLALSAGRVGGEEFPSRPISLLVPFAAGGPTDTLGRILAEAIQVRLGRPVAIENVSGASGSVAMGRVAQATPDGYTIGIGHWGTNVLNGAIYDLPYDLVHDLTPVAMVANGPQIIAVSKDLPANNLKELIAWLKANPGKALAGTAGAGSAAHIGGVFFQYITGTQFKFVPYRGTGPAMTDLVAGRVDLMFDQASNSLPQVRSGKIKAVAVTAKTRLSSAPDIPTVDEAGVTGLYVAVWHGIWAPKSTPSDIVSKLNAAFVGALADKALRRRFADLGQEVPRPEQQTPEALAAFQQAEIERWWPVVKTANIKPE